MRVLLIGKYPPAQGGIATKTHWLVNALVSQGLVFDIVTAAPPLYRCADFCPPPHLSSHWSLSDNPMPWFLPEADLTTERLATAALHACASHPPDVVEVNYLAPFGLAALLVARELGVPLLARHAGSDLAKLLSHHEVAGSLVRVLKAAAVVATTVDAQKIVAGFGIPAERTVVVSRYVPDPRAFTSCPRHKEDGKVLLVAGKLNYHWRWKALDTLMAALERAREWNVRLVGGGKGDTAFRDFLAERGSSNRFHFESFQTPDAMPAVIAESDAVWAVRRPEDVPDVANLIWEAAAVGRTCFVAENQIDHLDLARLGSLGAHLRSVDASDPSSVSDALTECAAAPAPPAIELQEIFADYVAEQRALYHRAGEA